MSPGFCDRHLPYDCSTLSAAQCATELGELGMTEKRGNEIVIPERLWGNFVNLDEKCISLDGSQGGRGGRPVVFYDPRFPKPARATSKSALTSTMIGGCTARGEPLPPHFQFPTKATAEERERIRTEVAEYCLFVRGKWGLDRLCSKTPTFGLNEKGGMNDKEFEDYLVESLTVLFPNAKPLSGQWVIIKVDSGPGRLNITMLARLRMMGFILYPGVPNTTLVTQEQDRLTASSRTACGRTSPR